MRDTFFLKGNSDKDRKWVILIKKKRQAHIRLSTRSYFYVGKNVM